LKTMNCPQCGGVLHLTQYPGVYHCRYCRNIIESNVIALHEMELQKYQLQLQEQALLEEKTARLKSLKKVRNWQYLCAFWWGFIALTFLLGIFAVCCPTTLSHVLANMIMMCLQLRAVGSLAVTCARPDKNYELSAPPACSQGVLIFLFWFADMFQWVFVILAS